MGFKDLKILKEKEYRLFLFLFLWLLIAYTYVNFTPSTPGDMFFFLPLLGISLVYFFASLFSKKDPTEITLKKFILYVVIAIPLMVFLYSFGQELLLFLIVVPMLIYIFITSVFTLQICYEKGVEFDDKLYKLISPLNFVLRSLIFVACLAFSIILMILFYGFGDMYSSYLSGLFVLVPIFIIIIFLILSGLTLVILFSGKYNAWLGVFFVWVSFFSWFLLFKAFVSVGIGGDGIPTPIGIRVGLYVFDLFLLLSTMGSLIKRRESMAEKMKINSNLVILLLILSKTGYEFAATVPLATGVDEIKIVGMFLLFVPIVLIMGLKGIRQYGLLKKVRKTKKKRKKVVKKAIKKGIFVESAEYCPDCGVPNSENSKFCKKCGTQLYFSTRTDEKKFICPKCETENPKNSSFCKKCGFKIKNS